MICRVCDANLLIPILDLGLQPWGNHFLTKDEVGHEPKYPLRVVYCETCSTPQLDYTVKKEIMFSDHTYLSGVTQSLSDHFRDVSQTVDATFFKGLNKKAVLDIGSNDGTQLKQYQALGWDVLGVESSKTAATIAGEQGVETLHAFFNLDVAKSINRKFQVINAAGVFFHLEELHSVTDGIREALARDGVFVVQFLYMKNIVDNLAFDQIYHEHLLYYNLKNIEVLLNRHGLEMFDAAWSPIHGGTIVGYVGHSGERPKTRRLLDRVRAEEEGQYNTVGKYHAFHEDIQKLKVRTIKYLHDQKHVHGKTIFGFGAPVKGNTLLNYLDIGPEIVDCLVEKNVLRRNLYSPGKHIPILIADELLRVPDIYFVLAWNFKEEILKNNQKLIDQGVEFFFPIHPQALQGQV